MGSGTRAYNRASEGLRCKTGRIGRTALKGPVKRKRVDMDVRTLAMQRLTEGKARRLDQAVRAIPGLARRTTARWTNANLNEYRAAGVFAFAACWTTRQALFRPQSKRPTSCSMAVSLSKRAEAFSTCLRMHGQHTLSERQRLHSTSAKSSAVWTKYSRSLRPSAMPRKA
eukprot:3071897-Amphidinium_carterae.1